LTRELTPKIGRGNFHEQTAAGKQRVVELNLRVLDITLELPAREPVFKSKIKYLALKRFK